MSQDDELKLTRRRFLQHTAMATAMTAGLHSIALKTDALAEEGQEPKLLGDTQASPYPYL